MAYMIVKYVFHTLYVSDTCFMPYMIVDMFYAVYGTDAYIVMLHAIEACVSYLIPCVM